MKSLIDLWNPKNKFLLFIKRVLLVVGLIIFLSALIVPFLGSVEETKDIFKWLWIGLIVLNLDIFSKYKHAKKDKTITPITTVFIILLLVYLYYYWGLLSAAVVAISSILVGIWEFYTTIALNKCIKFTKKMNGIALNMIAVKNFALGVIYVTSILLFILGHLIGNNIVFYVFGCLAVILLTLSILICVSQLSLKQKSIIGIIFFIVDIVSLIGLLVYLIFSIENANLRTIILTITSALIGGVLTLAGVAWTIRKGEKDRKEEEIAKNKPLIKMMLEETNVSFIPFFQCLNKNIDTTSYKCGEVAFKNFDNANFIIEKIIVNDISFTTEMDATIEKGEIFKIRYLHNGEFYFEKFILVVRDIFGNLYYFRVSAYSDDKWGLTEIQKED